MRVLEAAAKSGNFSHAYLFSGPRGTGKTSVARILAAAIGCRARDLYEMDAASNRGIDEVRELREAVSTLPFESKVKIYIIDEVHMLTREAFNALLKTLEEPPAHVIFILATTELHKVPETIVSRCQTFTFRKPTEEILKKTVERVAKAEKFEIDSETASLIATLGDDSFRDALGILQKVITISSDKKVSLEEVQEVTGAPKSQLVQGLVGAMINGKSDEGIKIVKQAAEDNIDIKIFTKLVMHELRRSMLADPHSSRLPLILKELLDTYDQIDRAYLPQLPLELAIIKLSSGVTI